MKLLDQRRGSTRTLLMCFALLAWLPWHLAKGHDARPVVVTISEQLPGAFQFSVRVPDTVEAGNQPRINWPVECEVQNVSVGSEQTNGSVLCPQGLNGLSLSLNFPYFNPSLATFYRLNLLDGSTMTGMLSPTRGEWEVPKESTSGTVAVEYFILGVEHIISGLDHLLFVLGLLVIARTTKRILWTVTGFTLAHSITLSLSSLGVVSIPIAPVEAVIALSILFLAYEISRRNKDTLTYHYPLIVSFGFGLLHGLGFASALGEIGLVENEIFISLLFFNLGVEAGQIAFILCVAGLIWCLHRVFAQASTDKNDAMNKSVVKILSARNTDLLASYAIGIPASYWLIDRVSLFLF